MASMRAYLLRSPELKETAFPDVPGEVTGVGPSAAERGGPAGTGDRVTSD